MATKPITRPFVGNHAETLQNRICNGCGMHRENPKKGNGSHLKRILWLRQPSRATQQGRPNTALGWRCSQPPEPLCRSLSATAPSTSAYQTEQ